MSNRKVFNPFYAILYTIIPTLIIYFYFSNKNNLYDILYNELILNDSDNYLRSFLYERTEIPTKFPSNFLKTVEDENGNTYEELDMGEIKKCPMTIDDITEEVELNNNSSKLTKGEIVELISSKKQDKLESFIRNINESNCGCLPVNEKIFTTAYLCKTIGFNLLFKINEKNKKNAQIISSLYSDMSSSSLKPNSKNLFMGHISYDASKNFIYMIFKIFKSFAIFNVIKLWIISISLIILCSTVSGSKVKIKKTIDLYGKKKLYYDGSKHRNIALKIIVVATFISFFYLLPPFIISFVAGLQFKKLGTLKNIIKIDIIKASYIFLATYLCFSLLVGSIFSGANSYIVNIAKERFNSKDYKFLNKLSKSFTLNAKVKKTNYAFYILQLVILLILTFSFYIGFTSNNSTLMILPFVMFFISFFIVFQYTNEGKFSKIFKKCPANNANSYSYTNNLINKSFWNITSGYVKYNYQYI